MYSKAQRHAIVAAVKASTGKDGQWLAKEADVTYPTLHRFLNNKSIHTSNEQKIIKMLRDNGWIMSNGGVVPVRW